MKTFPTDRATAAPARAVPAPASPQRAEVRRILTAPRLQAKLTVGAPDDAFEKQADRVADQVMRAPEGSAGEGLGTVQRVSLSASAPAGEAPPIVHDALRSPGQELAPEARSFLEPRLGYDLSQVRVHTGETAADSAAAVSAQAYTVGHHMVFGKGQYAPGTTAGRELIAHEAAHVVQQAGGAAPAVQRRLVTFGTLPDVNALLGLLGPAAGLTLTLNVATNQVRIDAVLPGAPRSAALRTQLTRIINHATQHAEVIIARGQPQVIVGAFPQPSDLTVTRVQQIDIDDILAIEAGAAGNGVAAAAHEIEENFRAHGVTPVAGVDRFARAHEQALQVEGDVATQLVGPGRRVANVVVPGAGGTSTVIADYENYYLVFTTTLAAATQNVTISGARRAPRVVVSTHTIDQFVSGSNAMPAGGAAAVAAAAASVAATPTATARVEGFADSTGGAQANVQISQRRANQVTTALVGAGVGRGRMHSIGRGAVNFVAPNDTPANRALNRRVVITVERPGP